MHGRSLKIPSRQPIAGQHTLQCGDLRGDIHGNIREQRIIQGVVGLIQRVNAETIRRDIAGILHTLNQAYENLYNNLLSDVAMDISSEIAALQGMLANDGLTGREFE